METKVSLEYFVTDCLWKIFFDSNSRKTHSNLISLTILVTLTSFALFQPKKIRAIDLQKKLKFPYLVNAFPIF